MWSVLLKYLRCIYNTCSFVPAEKKNCNDSVIKIHEPLLAVTNKTVLGARRNFFTEKPFRGAKTQEMLGWLKLEFKPGKKVFSDR